MPIPKSFNKNVDSHSVIVKGILLCCCLEAVNIDSERFIILLLYIHKVWCVSVDICITGLWPKDALNFILLLEWSCISVQVRPHDLASARYMQLSVRMSAAVSMSMNQSSSFEGVLSIECEDILQHGHGEVCFSLCCMQGVHVCLHSFVHWFLIRLRDWMWLEHHSEVLQFICEPRQLCHRCRWANARFQAGKLLF